MTVFTITPGTLTLANMRRLMQPGITLRLDKHAKAAIQASVATVNEVLQAEKRVYGINTGFGRLASVAISSNDLEVLQRNLLVSHAVGTGPYLPDTVVRLMMALKINALARGYSAIRLEVIEALITLYNANVLPCIPAKGSVGASGDLAPLAHMSLVLLGLGEAHHNDTLLSGAEALAKVGLKPISLAPKEGLALLNGTQASTALALVGLFATENVFAAALCAGALSLDAAMGSDVPFDARIHAARGYDSQQTVAAVLRDLLAHSQIRDSHSECDRIQDPYCLRCQPQVMGACLMQMRYVATVLVIEANAVSDNPLVFSDTQTILSGGNFHAEPVALVADALACAIAEIASLSERRIALLMDANLSGLPPFLVQESGVNSGFMMTQVTAAALVSENKLLAHPASVDSIPTSANQEDHVSMAATAAYRLLAMAENAATVVGIEVLAGCQGTDFHLPLKTSPLLQELKQWIRQHVPMLTKDRYLAPDITLASMWVQESIFQRWVQMAPLMNVA